MGYSRSGSQKVQELQRNHGLCAKTSVWCEGTDTKTPRIETRCFSADLSVSETSSLPGSLHAQQIFSSTRSCCQRLNQTNLQVGWGNGALVENALQLRSGEVGHPYRSSQAKLLALLHPLRKEQDHFSSSGVTCFRSLGHDNVVYRLQQSRAQPRILVCEWLRLDKI